MMYKVRYDLVAIPALEYLARNKREPRQIHSLAYTTQRLQVGFFQKNPIERSAAAAAAAADDDDDDDDVSQ